MSKAILVMDMPKGCDDCPLRYYNDEIDLYKCCVTDRQADWLMGREEKCPLKELPYFLTVTEVGFTDAMINMGWNLCIRKILGDEDETD